MGETQQPIVHTPGAWRVDETVSLGAYGVWSERDREICRVYNGVDDSLPRKERDANARLIAAAPDMLAVLLAVAKDPHADSDVVSLLQTLRTQAATVIAGIVNEKDSRK